VIVPARPEHAAAIGTLHHRFVGGLQAAMGERVCRIFYEVALDSPDDDFVYVYLEKDAVRGFASGARNAAATFRRVQRRRPFALAAALSVAVARRPALAAHIVVQQWADRSSGFCEAQLAAMAVDPRCRGRGLGRLLLEAVIERFGSAGIDYIEASVSLDNPASLHVLEVLGFETLRDFRIRGVARRRFFYRVSHVPRETR
jgi:ribosomal protein S18 acetylase RimI-like enzyme